MAVLICAFFYFNIVTINGTTYILGGMFKWGKYGYMKGN